MSKMVNSRGRPVGAVLTPFNGVCGGFKQAAKEDIDK